MAYTTLPTQSAGQTASAAGWANLVKADIEYIKPATARTTADQSVVSSTTFVDATGVSFPIAASETVYVRFASLMQISGTGDLKTRWTVPAAATGRQWYEGGAAGDGSAAIGADLVVGVGGTADFVLAFQAVIVNSTNAGTVQWQFAQFASDGTADILRANSVLIATRL